MIFRNSRDFNSSVHKWPSYTFGVWPGSTSVEDIRLKVRVSYRFGFCRESRSEGPELSTGTRNPGPLRFLVVVKTFCRLELLPFVVPVLSSLFSTWRESFTKRLGGPFSLLLPPSLSPKHHTNHFVPSRCLCDLVSESRTKGSSSGLCVYPVETDTSVVGNPLDWCLTGTFLCLCFYLRKVGRHRRKKRNTQSLKVSHLTLSVPLNSLNVKFKIFHPCISAFTINPMSCLLTQGVRVFQWFVIPPRLTYLWGFNVNCTLPNFWV